MATNPRPAAIPPIEIRDFSPGIADNPGIAYPPGQATRTNTYRCYALPSGALVPAFRNTYNRNGDLFEASNPDASAGYFCSGLYAVGPVLPTVATIGSVATELWIATEWGLTSPFKKRRLQRVKLDENPVATEDIITQSSAVATDITTRTQAYFCQNRSNQADPTQPGIPIVVIAWASGIAAFANVWEFPNDTTPTLSTPYVIANLSAAAISHQGRILWHVTNTTYSHGVNTIFATGENLQWTDTNDVSIVSVLQAFYPEAADGYSIKASMTANELLLIKESGAIVVYGDLDSPTVNNLPAVAGNAELFGCNGVRTPIGFFYPALGIWVWAGGDASQCISPHMLPDFYKPPTVGGIDGAWWYAIDNFAFLSNNFFFDTLTKAFWQIENPATVRFAYATGNRHQVYFAKNMYTQSSPALVWGYDMTLKTRSYVWQNHPLWETVGNIVNIRQIEIIAEGTGTIKITCTGLAGATADVTVTLLGAGAYVERFRENFNLQAEYVQVKIEADSGNNSIAGPTIHSITLHPDARTPVPTTV